MGKIIDKESKTPRCRHLSYQVFWRGTIGYCGFLGCFQNDAGTTTRQLQSN